MQERQDTQYAQWSVAAADQSQCTFLLFMVKTLAMNLTYICQAYRGLQTMVLQLKTPTKFTACLKRLDANNLRILLCKTPVAMSC